MDRHVRTLARLSIVFGVFGAAAASVALAMFGGLGPLWDWGQASGGIGLLAAGTVLFHLFIALPMILGGIFLFRFFEWARYFMVVLYAINLLNPPFGSVLGGYGLWVLLMPETEPLFRDPVVRRKYRLRA
jgi:hypothetical protein